MLLRLTTAATEEVGVTPHGQLSIFPVTGGSFDGERLRGTVLAVGIGELGPDGPVHAIEEIL
jgi:hypothetical protein